VVNILIFLYIICCLCKRFLGYVFIFIMHYEMGSQFYSDIPFKSTLVRFNGHFCVTKGRYGERTTWKVSLGER